MKTFGVNLMTVCSNMAQIFSGRILYPAVRSPAQLVHVDVSLGKALHPQMAIAAVSTVC